MSSRVSYSCGFTLCERRDEHVHNDFDLLSLHCDKIDEQAQRINVLEAKLAKPDIARALAIAAIVDENADARWSQNIIMKAFARIAKDALR